MIYLPFAIFAVAWLVLLFHGLSARKPVQGRLAWLASFALLDPLLTFLYWLFSVKGVGRASSWPQWVTAAAVVLSLFGWVSGLFPGGASSEVRAEDGSWPRSDPSGVALATGYGWREASSETSRGSSIGLGGIPRLEHVQILTRGCGPGVGPMAAELSSMLRRLPSVERIEVTDRSDTGGRAPDLRILVSYRSRGLPPWLHLSPWSLAPASYTYEVSTESWSGSSDLSVSGPGPTGQLHYASAVNATSIYLGLAGPGKRWLDQERFAEDLAELEETLRAMLASGELVDALPDEAFGQWQEPPAFGFLERLGAERRSAEVGLLTHTHVAWALSMPDWASLEEIREELVQAGYVDLGEGARDSEPSFRMQNGQQRVAVSPDEPLSSYSVSLNGGPYETVRPEIDGLEFTVDYRRQFSPGDREALVTALLEQPELGHRTGWTWDLSVEELEPLHESLLAQPIEHPSQTLARGILAGRVGDKEASARYYRLASAYVYAGYEPTQGEQGFREFIAKQTDLDQPLSLADFTEAGFLVLEDSREFPPTELRMYDVLPVVVELDDGELAAACLRVLPNEAGAPGLLVQTPAVQLFSSSSSGEEASPTSVPLGERRLWVLSRATGPEAVELSYGLDLSSGPH